MTAETPNKPEPVLSQRSETVTVERSVRYNRLLIVGAIFGAGAAALLTALFPVVPEGYYRLGQVVGFAAVLGGALGLLIGGVFALLLARFARGKRGTAEAIHVSAQQPEQTDAGGGSARPGSAQSSVE